MSSPFPKNLDEFGQTLRRLRMQKRLLQRKAAAAADMDAGLLGNIERGRRLPTEKQVLALAKVYEQEAEPLLAARACCEFRQKYKEKPYYGDCLQILNEEASDYG